MVIQCKGYYENGNYFINNTTDIPNKRTRITVIFHDVEDRRQQKIVAIKGILADALNTENELTDADWDEMAKLRTQTNASLSRKVKI